MSSQLASPHVNLVYQEATSGNAASNLPGRDSAVDAARDRAPWIGDGFMIATSPVAPSWRGTASEWKALQGAISSHCVGKAGSHGDRCRPGDWRSRVGQEHICAAHEMLADQQALDSLLFARRIRLRLLAEELGAFEPLVRD